MRNQQRNLRPFYYCQYEESSDQYDEYGNLIPEPLRTYGEPVLMYGNISAASGTAQVEQFGNLDSYNKVITTADMSCPIDEHTVLFVDKEPEFNPDDDSPMFDYIVKRVAKSLNGISIAIRKVDVG